MTISPLKRALIREFGFKPGDEVILRTGSGDRAPSYPTTIAPGCVADANAGVVRCGSIRFDALTGTLAQDDPQRGRIYSSIRRAKPPGAAALKGGV